MAISLQNKVRPFYLRHAPGMAVLGLIIVLGFQLAHWSWAFIAPRPGNPAFSAPQINAESAAHTIAAAHLFGQTTQPSAAVSNDHSLPNIRLKGVFAAVSRQNSYAIVNTGIRIDQTLRIGEDILPGIQLKSVHPLYIVVSHDGVLKRLNLDNKNNGETSAPASTADHGISPLGYNAYRISRQDLTGTLQTADSRIRLGQLTPAPGGGMLVTEAASGSIAEKLGLQPGDVLRQINGYSLSSMSDLSRLYQKFKQTSQIQLELTRAGKVLQLRYTVQ